MQIIFFDFKLSLSDLQKQKTTVKVEHMTLTTSSNAKETWYDRYKYFINCKTKADVVQFLSEKTFTSAPLISKLENPHKYYHDFSIRKVNGKKRFISAPKQELLHVQKFLSKIIYASIEKVDVKGYRPAHGFMPNRSIMTNATYHLGARCILSLDLTNFFPSISWLAVVRELQKPPFNLELECAKFIANLCCHKGALPQGAPTSPPLSNLVCRSMDADLERLASRNNVRYSRYADDITISTVNDDIKFAKKVKISTFHEESSNYEIKINPILTKIVESHGFQINNTKTKLLNTHDRMEVTGIVINDKPNKTTQYKDNIRAMLHAWEKYGLAQAQGRFDDLTSKNRRPGAQPGFVNSLRGKIEHLRFVRGAEDPTYQKFTNKMNYLLRNRTLNTTAESFIENKTIKNKKQILAEKSIIALRLPDGRRISFGTFISPTLFTTPWSIWQEFNDIFVYAEVVQPYHSTRNRTKALVLKKSKSFRIQTKLNVTLEYVNSEKNFAIFSIESTFETEKWSFSLGVDDNEPIPATAESRTYFDFASPPLTTNSVILPAFKTEGGVLFCEYVYATQESKADTERVEMHFKYQGHQAIEIGSPTFEINEKLNGLVTKVDLPELRVIDINFIRNILRRIAL